MPNLDGIHECYEVIEQVRPSDGQTYYSFAINIGIHKLRQLIENFIENLEEPCFFLCEIPASHKEEAELRKSAHDPFHRNAYYKDCCSRSELLELFAVYGEWFIQDGMINFGFASLNSKDELFIAKYKIANIFTSDIKRYKSLLSRFQIPQEEKIKTVWANFTQKAPGECSSITIEGKSVHAIIKQLQNSGLYLAEQREEK